MAIPLKRLTTMQTTSVQRNLVAHNYGSMSREIIWETAVTDIPALKSFCDELLEASNA